MLKSLNYELGIYTFMLLIISCGDREATNKKDQPSDTINARSIYNIKDSSSLKENNRSNNGIQTTEDVGFSNFSKNFKKRNLPYELSLFNKDWVDFYSPIKEINRDSVVKFLCEGNKNKILASGGGYEQFYYGYQINIQDSIIGLIYYRTSSTYSGYVLSMFNKKGKMSGELFLAGTNGEYDIEAQKEANLFENGQIEIKEIILNKNTSQKKEMLDAKIIRSRFEVLQNGEVVHLKDPVLTHNDVYQDRDSRFRLIEK